ncbi:hypothetical protein [Bdellovibrio bacteriovorus]|uniref:Uncharacterized protein n=1 Tax=Bdellovibrio bacteriovorus str. Tiberius TaxID=1069642 RepID=K7ZF86_BDEBC|nr:hypothetical protein [Bdellovibrio bacteriovorus]AFY01272.1 hypothetical protein Bdt_1577 [Bdellovibrio bacteriovorus str. Tiberius]
MSSFDDLKEKLVSDARVTWERIQESGAYNQLRDRYENMTPAMQKLTLVGGVALVSLIILSIPYGKYTQSTEYVGEFESKRMTIRELLKVSRESSDVPQIPQAPSMDMIRNNIDNQIKAANLLPEQIKGTEIQDNNSNLVPKNLTEGLLQVSLAKLNIRQVLDLGYQFQSINPSVKMKDMVMTANREDNRYFDVVYKMVALAVPAAPAPEAPEPPSRGNRFKRNNNNDSGDE